MVKNLEKLGQGSEPESLDSKLHEPIQKEAKLLAEALTRILKRRQKIEASEKINNLFLNGSENLLGMLSAEETFVFCASDAVLMLEAIRMLDSSGLNVEVQALERYCLRLLRSYGVIDNINIQFDINQVEIWIEEMIYKSLQVVIKSLKEGKVMTMDTMKSVKIWFESGFVTYEELGTTKEEFEQLVMLSVEIDGFNS